MGRCDRESTKAPGLHTPAFPLLAWRSAPHARDTQPHCQAKAAQARANMMQVGLSLEIHPPPIHMVERSLGRGGGQKANVCRVGVGIGSPTLGAHGKPRGRIG